MITQARDTTQWRGRSERNPEEGRATPQLSASQRQDLRLAAAQMMGAARRAFQAEMTLKYCHGSARFAETLLGWSREAVEVGLAEHRTGIRCVGAHSAWSAQTLGGEVSGGGCGPTRAGRSTCAAGPDLSLDAGIYAPHGQGSWRSAAGTRNLRDATPLPQYHGGSVKPHGLSLAQSPQSEAAEKDSGN